MLSTDQMPAAVVHAGESTTPEDIRTAQARCRSMVLTVRQRNGGSTQLRNAPFGESYSADQSTIKTHAV